MFYPRRNSYVIIGRLLFLLALVACSQEPVEATMVVKGGMSGHK